LPSFTAAKIKVSACHTGTIRVSPTNVILYKELFIINPSVANAGAFNFNKFVLFCFVFWFCFVLFCIEGRWGRNRELCKG
jgi:hypothetical protein